MQIVYIFFYKKITFKQTLQKNWASSIFFFVNCHCILNANNIQNEIAFNITKRPANKVCITLKNNEFHIFTLL